MPREALIVIIGGLFSAFAAMAFLGGSALSLMLVYLAPIPLLLVGLGLGPRAATMTAGVGFLATGIFGGVLAAGIYGLVHALPAWTVARLVMLQRQRENGGGNGTEPGKETGAEWYPLGPALAALALLSGGLILLADLNAGESGLDGMLNAHLGEAFQVMLPALDEAGRERVIDTIIPFFPGVVGASWVIMTVANAAIAQGMLVRMGWNLRPSPAYAELELPHWVSWPLGVSAAAALIGSMMGMEGLGYIGRNITMVFAIPYFFLGLAVIHTLARRVTFASAVLVMLYLVVLMSGWAAVVVAGVGVTEQWIGLRDRSGDQDTGQTPGEDEN